MNSYHPPKPHSNSPLLNHNERKYFPFSPKDKAKPENEDFLTSFITASDDYKETNLLSSTKKMSNLEKKPHPKNERLINHDLGSLKVSDE